jgi:hypothetical protein
MKFGKLVLYAALLFMFGSEFLLFKLALLEPSNSLVIIINMIVYLALALYDTPLCLNLVLFIMPFKSALPVYKIGLITFDLYMLGVTGLVLIAIIKSFINPPRVSWGKPDFILMLFLVFGLSFFLISPNIMKSGYAYFHSIFIPFLIYLLIRLVIDEPNKFEQLKVHILVSVAMLAIGFIFQYVLSHARIYAFNIDPLKASIFFIMAFFLSISYKKTSLLPVNILYLTAFIVCFSRNFLLGLLLSPFYYLIVRTGFSRAFFVTITAITLALTISLAGSASLQDYSRAESRLELHYTSAQLQHFESYQRLINVDHWRSSLYGLAYMWHAEYDRFLDNPIIGVGIGNTHMEAASCHNVHIQLLTYTGLVGYALFMSFFFTVFPQTRFNITPTGLGRDISFLMVIALMIYMNGITNGLFHGDFNYSLFMVLALIQNLKHLIGRKELSVAYEEKEPLDNHLLPISVY